jgi:hypothetical protein
MLTKLVLIRVFNIVEQIWVIARFPQLHQQILKMLCALISLNRVQLAQKFLVKLYLELGHRDRNVDFNLVR